MSDVGKYWRSRTNMLETPPERWRPPLLPNPGGGILQRSLAVSRRFFDIQAGSVWRDVAAVVPNIRGTILDVGSGAQPYRPLVHPDATYMAIDTEAAKPHFGYEMPGTRYFAGDVWPVANASVDFILCTETLEHVLDTKRFLAEASRTLKTGGTILLTVPFAARWHFIPYDYWRFTPSSMDHLLRDAGFDGIGVYARGNALTVACYKMMALVLPLLATKSSSALLTLLMRIAGLCLAPVLVFFAVLANVSLLGRGGNDCLGYTLIAHRAGEDDRASLPL
jgi:SAM-dependent methyltransferase